VSVVGQRFRRWGVLVAAVLGVLVAGAMVGGAPARADEPPKLDLDTATAALADQQIYRAPGAVARFDEDKVRAAMSPDTRILVAPYTGRLEKGGNYADGNQYYEDVYVPLTKWAHDNHRKLIYVTGIFVAMVDGPAYGPADLPSLRRVTSTLDVTSSVLILTRYASGMSKEQAADIDLPPPDPVKPSGRQLDDVTAALRKNRVYNAPGREDPIDPVVTRLADEVGLRVRVAAFPILDRGAPAIDYAPALAKRFPGEVVLVAQGRWLDIAAPDQAKAVSARDYAFGRFEQGSFRQGSAMTDRIATVLDRLHDLLAEVAFGRPQPDPQPKPVPFDVRLVIGSIAPWVLVGSAVVIGGAGLAGRRARAGRRAAAERRRLDGASGKALAAINLLGARILAVEESGEEVNPAAAERHATARTLYDQALTAQAMAEVEKVADEGMALETAVRS
jgi:hypothetical protein